MNNRPIEDFAMDSAVQKSLQPEACGPDPSGMARVWQAVIVSAIREWISGPLRRKIEAEKYLFGGGTDFAYVCESAGMNPDSLRMRLARFKRQSCALQPQN
jgi:hypothetical protein